MRLCCLIRMITINEQKNTRGFEVNCDGCSHTDSSLQSLAPCVFCCCIFQVEAFCLHSEFLILRPCDAFPSRVVTENSLNACLDTCRKWRILSGGGGSAPKADFFVWTRWTLEVHFYTTNYTSQYKSWRSLMIQLLHSDCWKWNNIDSSEICTSPEVDPLYTPGSASKDKHTHIHTVYLMVNRILSIQLGDSGISSSRGFGF